ncbi:MAG TPA: hypothetical protein PKY05_18510, partial [Fibrobacteria bacterium]|nr:hypothetical protein [Fibrobacteria bacterium]
MRRFFSLVLSAWVPAFAATVPEPLRPWVPWVLRDVGDRICPTVDDESADAYTSKDSNGVQRRCLSVSEVEVDATREGATFRMSGWRWTEGYVYLPAAEGVQMRLHDVRRSGKPVPVIHHGGEQPRVVVAAGPFLLEGRLSWRQAPQEILLPGNPAVVRTSRDGRREDPGPSRGIWKLSG